jgi:hypothetical protein
VQSPYLPKEATLPDSQVIEIHPIKTGADNPEKYLPF